MPATRDELLALALPFPPDDVEWRPAPKGAGIKNGKPYLKVLAYLTNRAIMDRLDTVVGPENWRNVFRAAVGASGGVMCGIAIRVERWSGDERGEWVMKFDAADETDIEATKGGVSSAMKRAAVQWGIGRLYYRLDEGWATFTANGAHSVKIDNQWYRWDPPALPAWALPPKGAKPAPAAPAAAAQPAPEPASAEQLATIEGLLGVVADAAVVAKMRARLAKGLTSAAAVEAVRYLTGIVEAARPNPQPGAAPNAAVAPAAAAPAAVATPQPAQPAGPQCPECNGPMWDNRTTKTNPKAPDYKCKDKACEGFFWPGQWPPKAPVDPATLTAPANWPNQLRAVRGRVLGTVPTRDLLDAIEFCRAKGDGRHHKWIDAMGDVVNDRSERGDPGPQSPTASVGPNHNTRGDLPDDPAAGVLVGAGAPNDDQIPF